MNKPLQVVLLWHMHQPDYRDPVRQTQRLPWVYLHGVKDYREMLLTAQQFPQLPLCFNLVPTLVEQLQDYSAGRLQDEWLQHLRLDPARFSAEQSHFLLRHAFSVDNKRHIDPYPRFQRLAQRQQAGELTPNKVSTQELRDLQVLFLLAWSGHHMAQEAGGIVAQLRHQQQDFSEEQKQALLQRYDTAIAEIIPLYRQLEEQGSIELSWTPYAHPILPLLCRTQSAQEAAPHTPLPRRTYNHPEDARLQLQLGNDLITSQFGPGNRGIWPAEGAVSQEALRLMQQAGATWAATDEGILAKSLPQGLVSRSQLYQLWQWQGLPLFFRDQELSDRIGFVYSHWQDSEAAASDLIARLEAIAADTPGGVVSLILDGENCWEHYPDNGYFFLQSFYQQLLDSALLSPQKPQDVVANTQPLTLEQLQPGSWIHSDFGIWIGHPEENQAWEWLSRSRHEVMGQQPAPATAHLPAAWRHLLRAQGSDWFWWYGDQHQTAQADIFDELFRHHLQAMYQAAALPVPNYLYQVIQKSQKKPHGSLPTSFFTPHMDGRCSHYFEWLCAGWHELDTAGAMHGGAHNLGYLYYGYDSQACYLRLDISAAQGRHWLGAQGYLELSIHCDEQWQLHLQVHPDKKVKTIYNNNQKKSTGKAKSAWQEILEMQLPRTLLEPPLPSMLEVYIQGYQNQQHLGRWPASSNLQLPYYAADSETIAWPL